MNSAFAETSLHKLKDLPEVKNKTTMALAARVHGHEKVPAGGHLRSPLVATKVPTCGWECQLKVAPL